ncbi:hypothetical protein GOP47_0006952 [Adiantum capillus-veneris]|uniref:CHHC U11-48K-type domain-containing protein n=1 Tax=Adiantum capillus-veneris TaxID=13818 RepID=A0A9D4UZZ6_ADICA|nr:hypothetical protein GOP47_0006952 [Adiantum capillus-veneris]
MSGPPLPPPPPPPGNFEWHTSSGFQNEYYNAPPPPGVSSGPSTLSFPWSPAGPGLASHSHAVGAGVYWQPTPVFLNTSDIQHCLPSTTSIQSHGVVPGIYLQQPTPTIGYGPVSFSYGTQSGAVAHNTTVSHASCNILSVPNPFSVPQHPVGTGSMHGNDVPKPTSLDGIDVKELIPNLRGLIPQVNESVRKILSMLNIKPDTLPLKSLDPQVVGSTREHMASHNIIEDSVDHRASFESLQRSDEFMTASTIFSNILISSRKSRENAFYKDAPGVVQVPVNANDESFKNFKLPDFAMGERWDELTSQSFDTDREVRGTLLPSRYWLVSKEMVEWKVLPKKLTSDQLKAIAGLPLVQQADLKKWLLTHARSYGVTCSRFLADHIVILLVFCLRAIYREAAVLIDSGEKLGLVDCRTLHQTASWLSIQLSSLNGAACSANLVLGFYKYAFRRSAYCSVRSLQRSNLEGVQKVESVKVDGRKSSGAGLEQESHNHPRSSSEACTDRSDQSSCVGEGVLCLQHLAAAILTLHAQAVHDKFRAFDLVTCSPDQRSALHTMVTNKAAEVRSTRADYRAVLEHDGLMWQRPQNQDFKTNKTKEELLAEERDYKRRRMSYRGKKVQRTPAEVLRDIIEGHMEDIIAAGGIGCIGRRPQDAPLPESKTVSASGTKDNTINSQNSRSSSRDAASKEMGTPYHDYDRYSRSESRESFRTERGGKHRSSSMSLSSGSQRHEQSYRERSGSMFHVHSGDNSSERRYESARDHRRWGSKVHGMLISASVVSPDGAAVGPQQLIQQFALNPGPF